MDSLGDDVLTKIFAEFINLKTLLTCNLICHRWKKLINHTYVWKIKISQYITRKPLPPPHTNQLFKFHFLQKANLLKESNYSFMFKKGYEILPIDLKKFSKIPTQFKHLFYSSGYHYCGPLSDRASYIEGNMKLKYTTPSNIHKFTRLIHQSFGNPWVDVILQCSDSRNLFVYTFLSNVSIKNGKSKLQGIFVLPSTDEVDKFFEEIKFIDENVFSVRNFSYSVPMKGIYIEKFGMRSLHDELDILQNKGVDIMCITTSRLSEIIGKAKKSVFTRLKQVIFQNLDAQYGFEKELEGIFEKFTSRKCQICITLSNNSDKLKGLINKYIKYPLWLYDKK